MDDIGRNLFVYSMGAIGTGMLLFQIFILAELYKEYSKRETLRFFIGYMLIWPLTLLVLFYVTLPGGLRFVKKRILHWWSRTRKRAR